VCACHECATHGLHPAHGLEAHRFEHLPDDPRARLQVSVAAPARTVRQVNDKLDAAVRKNRFDEGGGVPFQFPDALNVCGQVRRWQAFAVAHGEGSGEF
jgi:hypothetical protein